MALNFDTKPGEFEVIAQIAERADRLLYNIDGNMLQTRLDTVMDVTLANNDCPLDLERLLAAPNYDFCHDILGIRRHLNRETGIIEGCFLPRYAINQGAPA